MRLLGIECLGDGVSAAVSVAPGKILLRRKRTRRQDENLVPIMDAALRGAKTPLHKIDAIAVATGPGRFTATRIGATFANTLSWSLGKPVIGVTLFEAFAARLTGEKIGDGKYVLAFPASRGEFYVQEFEWADKICKPLGAPRWAAGAEGVLAPRRPVTAADLLGVAACKLMGGAGGAAVEPLYLKPANYLKK